MFKNILFIIFSFLGLVGCGTKPIYLKQEVYQAFELDPILLETKKIPAPPEKTYFLTLDTSGQRNSLVDYSLVLQTTIGQLNKQLEEINFVLTKHNNHLKNLNGLKKESYE